MTVSETRILPPSRSLSASTGVKVEWVAGLGGTAAQSSSAPARASAAAHQNTSPIKRADLSAATAVSFSLHLEYPETPSYCPSEKSLRNALRQYPRLKLNSMSTKKKTVMNSLMTTSDRFAGLQKKHNFVKFKLLHQISKFYEPRNLPKPSFPG